MMCFFLCLCVMYSITYRNNASFSNFGGGFRWQSAYPWYILSAYPKVKNNNFPTVF
ncbi:Uncharacterized protein FWK35_00010585 [Aphis craccivora]|uniref:Uncharacterized protein n=1 Tax=Aphis craccivora TaxID=307492 RepID=A0A6G0YUT6_APHCR|nr:Uncharacterized protein FWK35_00010585 [Aphis craccivora]